MTIRPGLEVHFLREVEGLHSTPPTEIHTKAITSQAAETNFIQISHAFSLTHLHLNLESISFTPLVYTHRSQNSTATRTFSYVNNVPLATAYVVSHARHQRLLPVSSNQH